MRISDWSSDVCSSDLWILLGDFDEASGHRAGGELQAAAARPDAVFAANDMMALGSLFALNHAGIQAPCDIAIAGVDDIPLARYVHPSLTTMRVDIAELGGRALRALVEGAAQAPDADGDMALAEPLVPQLMVRDSSVKKARGKARVPAPSRSDERRAGKEGGRKVKHWGVPDTVK